MESDKLNDGENPPASTSFAQDDVEFALNNRLNDAADSPGILHNGSSARIDPPSFPYTLSTVAPFPWKHMHGAYQPYEHSIPETHGNLMVELNQLHNLQTALVDPNSTNTRTGIPRLYRQDLPFPGGNIKRVSPIRDNTRASDTCMNDSAFSNSFQTSEVNRNFALIRGNAGGGHEMTRHGGDAGGGNIHGLQIKDLAGLGGSRTYNPQNSGQIKIDNHEHAAQFGCPRNIDGSFISLGIGGKTDSKSKSILSSREFSGELDAAVFPQLNASHVQQATGHSLNPGQHSFSGFPSFQSSVGGFRSPGNGVGGWASTNNNVGVIGGTNTSLILSPFPILHGQADIQHGFPKPSNRNLGFVYNRDRRYANLDPYKGFTGELATSSRAFSSNSTRLLDSGQNGASALASESGKFTWATAQPTSDQLQKRSMESVQKFSPESSMVYPSIGFNGSSTRQENSGQFFPFSIDSAAQAFGESAQLRRRKRVQLAGQLFSAHGNSAPVAAGGSLFPTRTGVQVRVDRAAQAAGSGIFPQRLGIQVNDHSATQAAGVSMFPRGRGTQVTGGHVPCAAERGLYPREMGIRTPSCFQGSLPPGFFKDHHGPASTTGYGLSQASNALGGPSKRGIIRPPPASPRIQCKKMALRPPILPSMPFPPPIPPAISIPSPVSHTTWQGSDGLPEPTGHKCMLCKRDLSFATKGQVYQPTMPPAVAVLPCGHTFHDHCLQLITPQDQTKDPPCIPCAIGESCET